MAQIKYTAKEKAKADEFDGMEAEYLGKVFQVKKWGGDNRTLEARNAAYKVFLEIKVTEDAQKEGKPLPEKEGR